MHIEMNIGKEGWDFHAKGTEVEMSIVIAAVREIFQRAKEEEAA